MKSQRGSLLIELIVGTGLLAGGLFAVFLGLVTLSDTIGANAQRQIAITLAANTIATVRAGGYAALTVGQSTVAQPDLPAGEVTTTITQPATDLYDVTVTARWTKGGQTRTVELVTKVANDGLESL